MTTPVDDLDDVFHAKARLGITTALLAQGGASDFPALKRELGLSDGNLGSHLRVLEDAGYVDIEKGFQGRRPRTTVRLTAEGRDAFAAYLDQLEAIVAAGRRRTTASTGGRRRS